MVMWGHFYIGEAYEIYGNIIHVMHLLNKVNASTSMCLLATRKTRVFQG